MSQESDDVPTEAPTVEPESISPDDADTRTISLPVTTATSIISTNQDSSSLKDLNSDAQERTDGLANVLGENSNAIEPLGTGKDGQSSPPIIYENDFDLYTLLKEMIIRRASMKRVKKSSNTKSTNEIKSYSKALTARLLDSHFADGRNEWSLIDNGMDLYRGKVNCIGTDVNDFDYGDPVFLDLQPLSTRIKLMCKLIIIIQGACVERSGPPKLVQDRCLQFDGVHERHIDSMAREHLDSITINNNNLPKIKSNSCENLLSTSREEEEEYSLFTYLKTPTKSDTKNEAENEKTSADEGPAKLSVFGTCHTTNTTTGTPKFQSRQLNDKKKYRKRSNGNSGAISDDEALLETYSSCSHHYHQHHHYFHHQCKSHVIDDQDTNMLVSSSCDLESYYRYRISKCSVKDYASAPYYQYSFSKKESKQVDQSTNTFNSYLSHLNDTNNLKTSQASSDSPREFCYQENKSTCTDDLISGFDLGYFSKCQLLSSQSLYGKKTSLMTSYASISLESSQLDKTILSSRSKVPIQINFRNKSHPPGQSVSQTPAPKPTSLVATTTSTATNTSQAEVSTSSVKATSKQDAESNLSVGSKTTCNSDIVKIIDNKDKPFNNGIPSSTSIPANLGDKRELLLVTKTTANQAISSSSSASATQLKHGATGTQVTSFKFAAKDPIINITIPTSATCTFKYTSDLIKNDPSLESIKAGPKKSKDWSLFKPDLSLFSSSSKKDSKSEAAKMEEKKAVLSSITVEQEPSSSSSPLPLLTKTTVVTTTTTTTTTKKTKSPTESSPPGELRQSSLSSGEGAKSESADKP